MSRASFSDTPGTQSAAASPASERQRKASVRLAPAVALQPQVRIPHPLRCSEMAARSCAYSLPRHVSKPVSTPGRSHDGRSRQRQAETADSPSRRVFHSRPERCSRIPKRDGKGRFAQGNTASKLRVLKGSAKNLIGLVPSEVVPWLRPFVVIANQDASKLVSQHGIEDDIALMRLADATASAYAVFRGLLALGAKGDKEALSEAKAWLREHRQSVLTLKGESREKAPEEHTLSRSCCRNQQYFASPARACDGEAEGTEAPSTSNPSCG